MSEFIENPESDFYQLMLNLARTYVELPSSSQDILDEYAKKLLYNLKKTDSSQPNQNPE